MQVQLKNLTTFDGCRVKYFDLHEATIRSYDAFVDFQGIASRGFERVILENIRARAHYLVLLTPSALEHRGERGATGRLGARPPA